MNFSIDNKVDRGFSETALITKHYGAKYEYLYISTHVGLKGLQSAVKKSMNGSSFGNNQSIGFVEFCVLLL